MKYPVHYNIREIVVNTQLAVTLHKGTFMAQEKGLTTVLLG